MSTTTELSFSKGKAGARAADFIAFVSDRQTEQTLKSFVLEQAMPHVHIAVGNIDDTIAYVSKLERSPVFLLVDLHGSVMPLSDLGRLAEVCEPSVQVVALGERNDVGLFRSLLKLGVHDYLVKPLTVELLKRTINLSDGKVAPVVRSRAGKTVTITGTRGGIGVTTVAVNLARHLADQTHRRVAYVDLNPYGGAANSMLGLQTNHGLTDVLQNHHRLDPQYVERTLVSKNNRLFVLSSELEYGSAAPINEGALARILTLLCDSFHYVILDVGTRVDALANEALDHSARVYLLADRSVHSTRETMRRLRYIETRDNVPPTSVLLNNPNAVTSGRVNTNDFANAINRSVLHEIPFEPKAIAVAENLGETPKDKSQQGFTHAISRIAGDLTGQQMEAARSLLKKFSIRKR
ncbi:pilus assembly protein CpaE [Pararobbsia alpina]|uniref:AAA family ATPase n=1 Tax=Pararobbsia alpina TaxID=621374 RepID=UPI0039A6EFCF